jgi:hypothetical protein
MGYFMSPSAEGANAVTKIPAGADVFGDLMKGIEQRRKGEGSASSTGVRTWRAGSTADECRSLK